MCLVAANVPPSGSPVPSVPLSSLSLLIRKQREGEALERPGLPATPAQRSLFGRITLIQSANKDIHLQAQGHTERGGVG